MTPSTSTMNARANADAISTRIREWLSASSLSDAGAVLALLRRNRIAALCAACPGMAPADSLWASTMPRLSAAYQASLVHGLRALQAAMPLTAAFEARGIPWLAMRGPFWALQLHDDPGAREFADIDLFVHPSRRWEALALARAAGWRLEHAVPPAGYFARYHLHWRLVHSNHDIPCELHWAFDHPSGAPTIDVDAVFGRTQIVQSSDWSWRTPAPVDHLLLAVAHLYKHLNHIPPPADGVAILSSGTGRYWIDVACLASALTSPGEWEAALSQAKAWHLLPGWSYASSGMTLFWPLIGMPAMDRVPFAPPDAVSCPAPAPWFRRMAHVGGFSAERWYDLCGAQSFRRRGVLGRCAVAARFFAMGAELVCYATWRAFTRTTDIRPRTGAVT